MRFGSFWLSFMEKAMATHSSTPAWKIPWMKEPRRLQSMGSLRVRHDWANSLSLFTFMHWRRKWQPTPVLLPGKSHGWRSLVGYSPWGHKESDTTELQHVCLVGCLFLTFQSYRTCLGASLPSTILMSILGLKIRILYQNSGTLNPGAITEKKKI